MLNHKYQCKIDGHDLLLSHLYKSDFLVGKFIEEQNKYRLETCLVTVG